MLQTLKLPVLKKRAQQGAKSWHAARAQRVVGARQAGKCSLVLRAAPKILRLQRISGKSHAVRAGSKVSHISFLTNASKAGVWI